MMTTSVCSLELCSPFVGTNSSWWLGDGPFGTAIGKGAIVENRNLRAVGSEGRVKKGRKANRLKDSGKGLSKKVVVEGSRGVGGVS